MKPGRKLFFVLTALLIAGAGLGFRSSEALKDIAPHPGDSSKILIASENGIYLQGENRDWKKLLSLETRSGPLRHLITHPRLKDQAFLLTERGILEIDLKTGRSQWLFREMNPPGNRVHSLAFDPHDPKKIYAGTDLGLFRSPDGGRTWRRPFRWPENQSVEFVELLPSHPPLLILGTRGEVFFSKNDGGFFESGFSLPLSALEEDPEERKEENRDFLKFTSLAFSTQNPPRLWVGTREGVYESRDNGIEWEKLPDHGLEDSEIRDLVYSEKNSQLIAATGRGVFRFDPQAKRWENLPAGLTGPPRALTLSSNPAQEKLLIASGSEVFEWTLRPSEMASAGPPFFPSPERVEIFRKLVTREPLVGEIQKQAIRYGGLGNGKIKRWHWGSRLRAFVPRVSFGKDFSVGNNVDIDRGGTNTPDEFILGPEDRDEGWDLDVSWELGDLVWSSAQTSIDSRAKLLVELRESILSQVTRIYFERRRLQMEIALSEPKPTLQEHWDELLRLDELTAQLDALTGGYLSGELERVYRSDPDLKKLWEN